MFSSQLVHRATIKRLVVDANPNTRTYQNLSTDIPCLLQPQDQEETVMAGASIGKGFKCYFDILADIQDSDSVTIDGEEFRCNGVMKYKFGRRHIKALLVREDS